MMRRTFVVGIALLLAAGAARAQRGPKGTCPGCPMSPGVIEQKAQSTAALQVKKAG